MSPPDLWSLGMVISETMQVHLATERALRQMIEALPQTQKAELGSLPNTLDSPQIVSDCPSNVLEAHDRTEREIERLRANLARPYRNQSMFPEERRGESDAQHATRPVSLPSGNFSQETHSSLEKGISQILMASCQEHDQLNTGRGECVADITRGRIKLVLLQGARRGSSPTECLDPEKGIRQHDLYPHRHEDANPFEENNQRISEGGPHVLFELTLLSSSSASCWMMERLARPEANPSATVFVAVIWTYTASIGTSYFIHSDSRAIDLWILCGGLCGLFCGWMMDWTLVEIIFRLLPGAILLAFWLGVHWAQRRHLSGHLVE